MWNKLRDLWEEYRPGGPSAATGIAAFMLVVILIALAVRADALETGWYSPVEGSGPAVTI